MDKKLRYNIIDLIRRYEKEILECEKMIKIYSNSNDLSNAFRQRISSISLKFVVKDLNKILLV